MDDEMLKLQIIDEFLTNAIEQNVLDEDDANVLMDFAEWLYKQ